ncbi:MAG: glycine oxidase ThiO, partial [Actinomycetota bacterium]|nr:glycine oxidase ThiO [Actinomycetota bacterium]
VVGGGVIGLAVAWRAAQRGLRVVLVERAELGAATSNAAAGMIAPVSEARYAEQPLLALGLASARSYPGFVMDLTDASGIDPGYLECGTLAAARDEDEAAALERELALRQRLGLTVRRLRASEARRLEPALSPVLRLGLEVPDDHAIDPRKLISALATAAVRAGAELRPGTEVTGLQLDRDRVAGLCLSSDQTLPARSVVLAAGVWSATLSGLPLEARVPLRPVKGQIMFLRDPAGAGMLSRALRMSAGYVVPRGDGRYVLGATVEERGYDRTVTAGPVYELLRDAIELVPGVAELVLDELIAGLRPATPDNAPVLGAGAIEGLHWATGHYRHGILLAPITAEILSSSLTGEEPDELASPFSPNRFASERRPGLAPAVQA